MLYSDIPRPDAPVIYTGAFPILTARPGRRSIYNKLSMPASFWTGTNLFKKKSNFLFSQSKRCPQDWNFGKQWHWINCTILRWLVHMIVWRYVQCASFILFIYLFFFGGGIVFFFFFSSFCRWTMKYLCEKFCFKLEIFFFNVPRGIKTSIKHIFTYFFFIPAHAYMYIYYRRVCVCVCVCVCVWEKERERGDILRERWGRGRIERRKSVKCVLILLCVIALLNVVWIK